jgi:hypothetical protein
MLQSTPQRTLGIRPGDVVDLPTAAEPFPPTRLHVVSTNYSSGTTHGFVYGWLLDDAGERRPGQNRQFAADVRWDQLALATVEVDLLSARRAVPLVVPTDEPRAVPLLPLLSWRQSRAVFDADWPDAGAYRAPHAHQHERCQHVSGCDYPPDACQAYETHRPTCPNCRQAARSRLAGSGTEAPARRPTTPLRHTERVPAALPPSGKH